jgi:hypothetical protein
MQNLAAAKEAAAYNAMATAYNGTILNSLRM